MNKKAIRSIATLLCAAILAALVSGCASAGSALPHGAAENDIITFKSNADNREIVNIGTQYYTPDTTLIDALQEKYPQYLFVLDNALAAGTNSPDRLIESIDRDSAYDLIITSRSSYTPQEAERFVDLSGEEYLQNYLLSSLNNVSIEGHIYCLPGVSSLTGIAYNIDMFEQNGWQVPTNWGEFFSLCEVIRAAGIEPFSACYKYAEQINLLFGTMCYDKLFLSVQDAAWVDDIQSNKTGFSGHMEPFFELAERFSRMGLGTLDNFSASLTNQRRDFWSGNSAMFFSSSSIFNYAKSENAPFEVGLMPIPAEKSELSGFAIEPAYFLAIPKSVESNPERLALMKDIMAYLSSPEGQRVLLSDSFSVSNVKGVDISENPAFRFIEPSYQRGSLYPVIDYQDAAVDICAIQAAAVKTIFEGSSAAEAIAYADLALSKAFERPTANTAPAVIAVAKSDFTMLETSYYMADQLRKAAGADVGLMINDGYFKSNLACIDGGDITADMSRFVLKGTGADDFLTLYSITGAKLKELIEHPIINGGEIDAFTAASGLKISYAPWNKRGSRVVDIAFENGRPIDDDKLYTVAAWAGSIDEGYITETLRSYDSLGQLPNIMRQSLEADGEIAPDISRRVNLIWPKI